MITWLQSATSKHHRIIFSFLLVVVIGSFVFYGYGTRGALGANAQTYLGVDLHNPNVQNRYRDSLVFSALSGRNNETRNIMQQIAELHIADSLNIPAPTDEEVLRIATLLTQMGDNKSPAESLNRFIEVASRQLGVNDIETRARFENYIKDIWRINKAMNVLGGSGHASREQIQRILAREKTTWTVEVATLKADTFNPPIAVDEAKAKAAFTANQESFRIPAKVEVAVVSLRNIAPDSSPVSDEEIVTEGYNLAEKMKFETGKVREQALARRSEIEKIIREDRAIRNLAGRIGEELTDQFPLESSKFADAAFQEWLKKEKASVEILPAFTVNNPPSHPEVSAEALKMASELNEKEWRTDMFRTENAAYFLVLQKRIESRLPEFEEVKPQAIAQWEKSQRSQLLNTEAERVLKALQSASTSQSFAQAAQAAGLTVSGPLTFVATEVPESLVGINESTTQVLETTGLNKVTPGIQTAKGDFVFLKVSAVEKPKDEVTAKEVDQLIGRLGAQNSYLMRVGLMVNLIEPPSTQEK